MQPKGKFREIEESAESRDKEKKLLKEYGGGVADKVLTFLLLLPTRGKKKAKKNALYTPLITDAI